MTQPAQLRKRALRYGIGIFLILGAVYLYINVVSKTRSLDPGNFKSAGYISASMQKEEGEVAVLIAPDGKITEAPGFTQGASDQPPIWSDDGQRLYFASDRENGESHVFRWNPARNLVERKSLDKRTKSAISMTVPGGSSKTMLVVAGGTVMEIDPAKNTSKQVLPPRKGSSQGQGEFGATSQFDQFYASIGTSFKTARWGKDKEFIVSVMRREEGEIMICQNVTDFSKPPTIVVAGDRVDFDLAPDGTVVFTCQKFTFPSPNLVPPELVKNGKIEYPFRHMIGFFKPGEPGVYEPGPTQSNVIAVTANDEICFGSPKVSPDGSLVLCTVGPYEGYGMMKVRNLITMAVRVRGGEETKTIVPHRVYEAEWRADGKKIVFTGEAEGKQVVFTVNADGSEMKAITGTKGSFRGARFSPAIK